MSGPAARVVVAGAGAMGTLFGALLAEAGCAVRLVDVAGPQMDALRRDGAWLETEAGRRRVAVSAGLACEQTGTCDLLLVFTKGMHTAAAAASVRHLLHPAAWVLTLQNGLGNAEAIGAALPGARLAIGVTSYAADLVAPGRVSFHGGGTVRLWSADGRHDPAIGGIADLLTRAGLHAVADPAVEVAIWEKVAFNAALNGICTLTRRQVGGLAGRQEALRLADSVVAETLAVARARGLAVDAARVGRAITAAMVDQAGHAPSMMQDLLAGRPLEVMAIHGAVATAGEQCGVPTPVTAAIRDLLHLVSPPPPDVRH